MDADPGLARRFCTEVRDAVGHVRPVLDTWTSAIANLLDGMAHLRHRGPAPKRGPGRRQFTSEYLNALYDLWAVSRVSDYLISFGCRPEMADRAIGDPPGHVLDPDLLAVHEWFFDRVGLESFAHESAYSPFHHEICAVTTDETAECVTLEGIRWRGFRFGDLMFCRAGVHVRAPSRLLDASVATTSTLYFSSRRETRPTSDLSDGWGSNSQWRTCFQRYYEDADGLHLNWDGDRYLGPDYVPTDSDLHDRFSVEQRRHLLLNRCVVTSPAPPREGDLFPFFDRLTVRESTWPLDPDAVLPDPEDRAGRTR
jgi:hypothetical protein